MSDAVSDSAAPSASLPGANPSTALDDLFDLYERWGADHYDEELSQLDHALQTAALAVAEGAHDALVAAALLHDVGHLLAQRATPPSTDPSGGTDPSSRDKVQRHEVLGARQLAGLFGSTVTGPVALHVRAKRYCCAVEPCYLERLSQGSQRSLERQGGPLTGAEARAFAAHPASGPAVRLRSWDDQGKVPGLRVAPLGEYRPLLERLAIA